MSYEGAEGVEVLMITGSVASPGAVWTRHLQMLGNLAFRVQSPGTL